VGGSRAFLFKTKGIMTDREKIKRMKELGQAMYNAAQYLTTDASRLRKAMAEWHQFIIYEL
jgi:hypothetical protein